MATLESQFHARYDSDDDYFEEDDCDMCGECAACEDSMLDDPDVWHDREREDW